MNLSAINARFWQTFDELVTSSKIVIDRPKDSPHPRMPELIYPLDYGYLAGTTAGDGDGIDVWLGSDLARQVTGIACTVDPYKRDTEVKVLLGCTTEDMTTIAYFLNVTVGLPCIMVHRDGVHPIFQGRQPRG